MNTHLADTESARLAALASYHIVDSLPEEDYDSITLLASQICQTPVSLITFVDEKRQWFKSVQGVSIRQTPRRHAFCARAIQHPQQLMKVTDARADKRFANNPLTTGELQVIFYAGVPLVDEDGYALGTLCVIDHEPRKLSDQQETALRALARQVVSQLQLRRSQRQLADANVKLQQQAENLTQLVAERTEAISNLARLQKAILEYAGLAIISTDVDGLIQTVNPATENLLGYQADELVGTVNLVALHDLALLKSKAQILSRQLGQTVDVTFDLFRRRLNVPGDEYALTRKDGRKIPVLLTTTPLQNEQGQITGYIGLVTDIRVLTDTRKELKKRNRELNTFFEVALDLHCIADVSGNVLKTNRSWMSAMGYSQAELATLNYFELVHPNDRELTRTAIREITPKQPIHGQINRFRRKDGLYRVVEWNVVRFDNLLYASARDITERQQSAKELKSLNQRLQLATQASQQGIWEYSFATNQLTWDQRMCEIHGVDGSGMTPDEFLKFVHPDDLPDFLHRREQLDEKTFTHVTRIIRPDGQLRYTESQGVVVRNRAGVMVRMVGVVWDITERKRAELNLAQSEERYRMLVNNLKEVVFQMDLNGNWTFLNPSWTETLGYTVDESLGQPFYNYISDDHQRDTYRVFRELIRNQQSSSRHVLQYRHKSGELRWAEIFAQLLFDTNGQPIGSTGTIMDITEQKKMLAALRESEQRFREFAENIDELFWIHSTNPLRLLYISPAFERMWGFPAELYYEDVSSVLTVILPDDKPRVIDALERYRQNEEVALTYRIQHPGSDIRWFNTRTFIMRNAAGEAIRHIGITTDVSSQKEKEVMLYESLQREQELNRLKSQFVSTASHEFRTPLATIQSSVDLIKLYLTQPKPTATNSIQRHLAVIEKQISNFSELLADILTIGRIEAGKISFNPQPTDLLKLVSNGVATHFKNRKDRRVVQLSIVGKTRPVYVDEKLMTHVLVNLLSNAFKFSKENPELEIQFDPQQLMLRVVDRGIGIPADDLPHLFETFFRARNAINTQGSGLGLLIARQFIELHGGSLTVQSKENIGTTFTVTLPSIYQPTTEWERRQPEE